MVMNMAANMLGLSNAATPLGLQAMRELQQINPQPQRASDAQLMFVVLNTAGVTLVSNVTAANTVTVRAINNTGATVDLASGTLKVRVSL
jgi:spore maturation protein SpmA